MYQDRFETTSGRRFSAPRMFFFFFFFLSYFSDGNTKVSYSHIWHNTQYASYPVRHLHGRRRSGMQLGVNDSQDSGDGERKGSAADGLISRSAPCSDWLSRAEAFRLARVRLRRVAPSPLTWQIYWEAKHSWHDGGWECADGNHCELSLIS